MKYKTYTMENTLESIIDYRGKTPKKSDCGIPTLSAKSVKNNYIDYSSCYYISETEYKRFMVRGFPKKGDILLTTEAPMGLVARLDRSNIAIAQRLLTLRGKDGVLDNDYLLYYLQSPTGQAALKARETGTTVTGIKQAEFRKIEISVPEYEVQKKISGILKAIDDKIAINNEINKNLEQQAQAIFKSWFVDFEPFNGNIPPDWKEYKLSEFLPVITGKKNANVSSINGLYPFFSCSQDLSWTDDYSFEGSAILVAGNGDFNTKFYNGKFEAYQRTYVLIPYNEKYTAWLYYAIKQNLKKITLAARGSVIKFITKGNLENFSFYAPRDLDNFYIIDNFDATNNIIASNREENIRLSMLRDTLLPKLMSGELDVSNLDL